MLPRQLVSRLPLLYRFFDWRMNDCLNTLLKATPWP